MSFSHYFNIFNLFVVNSVIQKYISNFDWSILNKKIKKNKKKRVQFHLVVVVV